MIDLYALTTPNVRKVYIMLEEVGLPTMRSTWTSGRVKTKAESQGQSQPQDPGHCRS